MFWLFTKILYLIKVSLKYLGLSIHYCICIVYTVLGRSTFNMYPWSMEHKSLINWSLSSIINHDAESYLQLLMGAEWKTGILNTVTAGISATTIVFWFTGPVKSRKNNFITLLIQQWRQNKLQPGLCFLWALSYFILCLGPINN